MEDVVVVPRAVVVEQQWVPHLTESDVLDDPGIEREAPVEVQPAGEVVGSKECCLRPNESDLSRQPGVLRGSDGQMTVQRCLERAPSIAFQSCC